MLMLPRILISNPMGKLGQGFSLSDLMYVTKRGMSDAITNVSQHLEHVTTALSVSIRR